MITPEQKIAQIEAALRSRYFPMVPKIVRPGRETWTEEQHDTDRLSRSLAAYTIGNKANITESIAAGAIVDGPDDCGIDAIFYDRSNSKLLIVQSKFKRNGAAPNQEEVLKTINGIRKLINRDLAGFNQDFQNKFDEIEEALDTPGVTINVIVAFLGEHLGAHAASDLDAYMAEVNRSFLIMKWELYTCNITYQKLCEDQAISSVCIEINLSNTVCVNKPRKVVYGQIRAVDIADLVAENGIKMFEKNIRYYLGSVAVNTSIQESVRRKPDDFFYLNNGITALAKTITSSGRGDRFKLDDFSIVNGAQTAGSISTAAALGTISPDAKVLITIIEISEDSDDFGVAITKARNYQNEVNGIDFAALDPQQERLRRELASIGIKYYYRPSVEAKVTTADSVNVEDAALAIACLAFPVLNSREIAENSTLGRKADNGVDYVVISKKEIGRLWEPAGAAYSRLFNSNLSGVRICRLVQIYRFVDLILSATETAEQGRYDRKMFFRHGRFFIMTILAHHCPLLVNKPAPHLIESDRILISQMVNELSEIIYIEMQRLQFNKGCLSIFRNQGDVQDLTDAVLEKLPSFNVLPSHVSMKADQCQERAVEI